MLTVTLYTRPGCHLCEEAKAELEALQAQFPHRLIEVDVESDPALEAAYGAQIPVLEIGPYRLRAPFTRQELMVTLGAAGDRRAHLESVDREGYERRLQRARTMTTADRLSNWLAHHYLALINLAIFLYVGLPFLAPVLMKLGATTPARVIYAMYSPVCHQLGFRSFFLFGMQAYYPREAAGMSGVQTFEQVTGWSLAQDPYFRQARGFIGNEALGYKIALCERDLAIYLGLLAFGLFYALSGRRVRPLHWLLWVIIGLGPVGLDGFSQLLSQMQLPGLEWLPYRESTPFLRTLTGALFGVATAWFALPNLEESTRETRLFYARKLGTLRADR